MATARGCFVPMWGAAKLEKDLPRTEGLVPLTTLEGTELLGW